MSDTKTPSEKLLKKKAYYLKNREKILSQRKQYWKENKSKLKPRRRKFYVDNRDDILEERKQYYEENRDVVIQRAVRYEKRRMETDINFRLKKRLKSRIKAALNGGYKSGMAVNLLGCSVSDLKQHLESKFQKGMCWDNYGMNGWHIDHIIPCDSFDLTNENEQRKCFHYTNLQPLWSLENIRKSNKIS